MGAGAAMERYRGIENGNIPQWQKILDSVANGANEMIWEKAVTVPILAKSKQAMLSLGRKKGQEVVRASVEASLKNSAYKAGGSLPSWVAEGLSEVATGVSNDIADKIYVDPNTQIGSHAFDDMVVGAVMGKAFSTPSDVATFLNKNDQRKLINKVLKSVPKDLGYEPYMNLVEVLSEREALTDMENNLATEFKGKYTPRIVELTDKANKIISEAGGKTVGTVEADNGMQEKVDYLIGQGVKIPEGTTSEGVDQLWKETKQKETETSPTSETIKTKESEKLSETQTQNIETQPTVEKTEVESLPKKETVEKVGEQKVETADFDNEGDLTDSGFDKATNILTSTIDEISDKYGIPKEVVRKGYNISEKGEYVSSVTPILEIGKSSKESFFRKIVKDIAIAMNEDADVDKVNRTVNDVFDDWLNSIENDTEFDAPAEMKQIFQALDEINTKYQEAISQQLESEVTDAGKTETKIDVAVPQERTEWGGIETGSVRNVEQDKAATEQVAPATEEKKEEKEISKVSEKTGIKPKNLRDVYKAGREVFGLNRVQALAQAVITDRIVGKIANRTGKTKEQIYSEIEYRKSDEKDLKKGKKLYQQERAKMFYSPTEKALGKIQQNKGTAEQFKAMLLKNGAKQAELDWMGWDEFAKANPNPTKADIQQWIDGNKVEVEEVTKGLADLEWEQSGDTYKYGDYEIEKSNTSGKFIVYHKNGGGSLGSYTSIDGAKNFVEAQLSVGEKRRLTKYDQYQLPGGENYKEVLLTMPNK